MNTLAHTSSSARRGFKIPVPVFAAVIAILAILAGWYLYDRIFRVQEIDPAQYQSLLAPTPRGGGGGGERFFRNRGGPPPANAGIGVLKRNDGFDVQIAGARARFSQDEDKLRLNVRFIDPQLFSGPDRTAAAARFNAIREPAAAAAANVTPEQIEKLKQIDVPREMILPDEARQTLRELGERYAAAPEDQQPGIEAEMTEHLRTVAAAALQPTIEEYARTAQQVREVLTPEQIAALRERR